MVRSMFYLLFFDFDVFDRVIVCLFFVSRIYCLTFTMQVAHFWSFGFETSDFQALVVKEDAMTSTCDSKTSSTLFLSLMAYMFFILLEVYLDLLYYEGFMMPFDVGILS